MPLHSKARFCSQHNQEFGHKCAAALRDKEMTPTNHDVNGYCVNDALPNKMCCALHQQIEKEFGKSQPFHVLLGRQPGQSLPEWKSELTARARERLRHTFGRHLLYGYMFND